MRFILRTQRGCGRPRHIETATWNRAKITAQREHGPGIARILLDPDQLPDSQVDLPASVSECTDGDRGPVLADLSVTDAHKLFVSLWRPPSWWKDRCSCGLLVMGLNASKWEEKANRLAVAA